MSQSSDRARNVFVSCLTKDSYAPVVSHLINYLKSDGIRAVIGRVEIGSGEPMDAMLRCSIENCDIYVIVFSENFATSNSRLWEVVAIAQAAQAMGKRILPVFYRVEAQDVKLKTGKYETQLSQHTSESAVTIEEWRNALRRIVKILGLNHPTSDCSDANLCQKIRGRVQDMIREKDQLVVTLKATITGCPNLPSLENLGLGSSSPTSLTLENVGIKSLSLQSQPKNLTEKTIIRNCHKLKKVSFGKWQSLKVFDIEGCKSIESLSDVGSAGKLEELYVANCQNLEVIEGLVVRSLRYVRIENCSSFVSIESKHLKIPPTDEESERSNSTPPPSSIISTSADHDEAKVEIHRPESSPGASSSTSLPETTQKEDSEEPTVEELNGLIGMD